MNLTEDVLSRIQVARQFRNEKLLLVEQSSSPITSEIIWEILTSCPREKLTDLAIELQAEVQDGEIVRKVKTNNIIGTTNLLSQVGSMEVIVEPKLPAEKIMTILDTIQDLETFHNSSSSAFGARDDLLLVQLKRCMNQISKSLSGGSLRGYVQNIEEVAYLRGRPNLSKWMSEPGFKAIQRFECKYSDLTIDTLRNQVFKAALIKCAKVFSDRRLTSEAKKAAMLLYGLGSVSSVEFTSSNSLRGLGRNSIENTAIHLSLDIIFNLTISPHVNSLRDFYSYSLNMAQVFERYVRKLFSMVLHPFDVKAIDKLSYPLSQTGLHIILDGLFAHRGKNIILEAKYKTVCGIDQLSRSDIYQLVAYSNYEELDTALAILCVPLNEAGQAAKLLGAIEGFNSGEQGILVLGVSLSHTPADVKDDITKILEAPLRKALPAL